MKNLIIYLIITGFTTIGFAQDSANEFEVALEEVEVLGINYKYLNAIGYRNAAEPVKLLTQRAASFDLKNSNIYDNEDEEQDYYVSFKIPEGKILAIYDNEGEIMRTSEKYKDISLPLSVSNAIVERYPGWKINSDIYRVTYIKDGELNKTYKLFIEKTNSGKRVVKTNENGKFI